MIDGLLAFAPLLARQSNGFGPGVHDKLVQLEAGCFWFRSRNRLFQHVLGRFFPMANNLLEIGCGTGFVLAGFAEVRPEIHLVGAEIYTSGLKLAQLRLPQVEFMQMDACHIPFADEFDVVGAFDVLEHVEKDQHAFGEIFKAVKSGGGAIFSVPQHKWLWSATDDAASHKRRYTRAELRAKVEAVGFRVLWMSSFISFLLPLLILSRLRYRIRPKPNKNPDVFREIEISPFLNAVFEKTCDLERIILQHSITLPLGGSLLCVARKE